MGFLSKLMFWKGKDEFSDLGLGEKGAAPSVDLGLGTDFGAGGDLGAGMQPSPGMPQQPSFQQPSQMQPPSFGPAPSSVPPPQMQPPADYAANKTLEVISSKLDALRAATESINQRLANLEAIARGEEEQRHRRRW